MVAWNDVLLKGLYQVAFLQGVVLIKFDIILVGSCGVAFAIGLCIWLLRLAFALAVVFAGLLSVQDATSPALALTYR